MDKLAVFVEGQTEEVFISELLTAIAGRQNVHIDRVSAFGGGPAGDRRFLEVLAIQRPDPHKRYYAIIYNSMGYGRVLSDIRDHYDSLSAQSFKYIIGLRDVKPQLYADIPTIRNYFDSYAPHNHIQPRLVLAIMEIESWFIAESSHFPRIDNRLTPDAVTTQLGYDPGVADLEQRPDPADDLRRVYHSVGRGYNKSRRHAERTVNALSYEAVYLSLRHRFPDLGRLISCLDAFFT